MSKKQQIFFLALSGFLAVSAAAWVLLVVNPKNTGNNPALPPVAQVKDINIPLNTPAKAAPLNQSKAAKETPSSDAIPNNIPPSPAPVEEKTTFTLQAGDTSTVLTFKAGSTLLAALAETRDNGKIFFAGKEYSGLGFYLTAIGPLRESAGQHLFYYINGQSATVGVSSYILKAGDIINWKLE